ncbi:MAG: hypothetical protein K2I63_04355 [Helicobacter sp.]|nr:hypothetical protein [Helicobacter sp.]
MSKIKTRFYQSKRKEIFVGVFVSSFKGYLGEFLKPLKERVEVELQKFYETNL